MQTEQFISVSPVRCPLKVEVVVQYQPGDSSPEDAHYAFTYTITITNQGICTATLLGRHWFITDANGKTQELQGSGVIGEHPSLPPGRSFRYTSHVIMHTPVSSMHGCYYLLSDDGRHFEAPIPAFRLATPNIIH